jgi:hypothetical protein
MLAHGGQASGSQEWKMGTDNRPDVDINTYQIGSCLSTAENVARSGTTENNVY